MKILAVDQSYKSCAYVVFENEKMIDFGVLTSNKSDDVFIRSSSIAIGLMEIYKEQTIDIMHIEGLAFGMSGNVTRDLAGLLFTIINICANELNQFEYRLIPPTSVKKFATGSGKASKTDMINALPEIIIEKFSAQNYKKTTGLSDLADAYWIGKHLKLDDK
jgi:Holliday junction resolvasome RuvABC endonuclease subunit